MELRGIALKVADILSNLVSPPVVAAVFGFIVGWKDHPGLTGLFYGLIYAFWMCVVPLGVVVFLYRAGRISGLHMSASPQERRLPYLVGIACAIGAFLTFTFWLDSPLLQAFALSNIVLLAVLGAINMRWLISNHTASIMSAAVFSVYVFGWQAGFWAMLLVGLVTWARWLLRKHTPSQLFAGVLVGALTVIALARLGWL